MKVNLPVEFSREKHLIFTKLKLKHIPLLI